MNSHSDTINTPVARNVTGSSKAQGSPYSSYVQELPLIETAMEMHLASEILGFSSPPPVFNSPQMGPQSAPSFLQGSSSRSVDRYLPGTLESGVVGSANSARYSGNVQAATGHDASHLQQPIREVERANVFEKQGYDNFDNFKMPVNYNSEHQQDQTYYLSGHQATQFCHSLSRRSLHFEDARLKTTTNRIAFPKRTHNVDVLEIPNQAAELLSSESPRIDSMSQRMPIMVPNHSAMPLFAVPRPSGIGLHLNSLVSTLGQSTLTNLDNLVEDVLAEDGMLETKTSSLASYHLESFSTAQLPEQQVTPSDNGNLNSEYADNFDDFRQSSQQKKRNMPSTGESDGGKRCNCRRTECLKLYCDCFAAGYYCNETCSCQGCFNTSDYEEKVHEAQSNILSRNPHAFAPKIIQPLTHSPEVLGEDGTQSTPSSARHKRGCKCRKSMCSKKYCECFQANVGCSSACQCGECRNKYGRRGEYGIIKVTVHTRTSDERLETTADDKLEFGTTSNNILHADLYSVSKFESLLPLFQQSDHVESSAGNQLISSKLGQSTDASFPLIQPYEKIVRSPDRRKQAFSIPEMIGQHDPFNDACDLTPLPTPSSMTIQPSVSSQIRDWKRATRIQLCSQRGRLLSGSLRLHGSPITSMLGENKHPDLEPDSELHGILENDTPEMLKDYSTPVASVKVTSPNKKRIAPARSCLLELGSLTAGGLRSGRKFILKSVPSFPALTPSVESEISSDRHQK